MILSDRSKMVHIHQKPCSLFKVGAHIQHELFQGTDRPSTCILQLIYLLINLMLLIWTNQTQTTRMLQEMDPI